LLKDEKFIALLFIILSKMVKGLGVASS